MWSGRGLFFKPKVSPHSIVILNGAKRSEESSFFEIVQLID